MQEKKVPEPTLYERVRDAQPGPHCWKAKNDHCYPHYHSTLELVYCHEGELEATLNGKSYLLSPNKLLGVPSYTVHRFHTAEYSLVSIFSLPLDYISSFRNLMGQQSFPICVLEASADTDEIAHIFNKLSNSENTTIEPYRLRGYIYTVLGILLDNISLEKRSELTEPHRLQDILSYIEVNFLSDLTLVDIASHFGYSKSHFSHIFNENVGCSITDYLGFLRARRAANLLTLGENNILDIAMESGFGSVRSFYRTFQKCFGVTPKEYTVLNKSERERITTRHPATTKYTSPPFPN